MVYKQCIGKKANTNNEKGIAINLNFNGYAIALIDYEEDIDASGSFIANGFIDYCKNFSFKDSYKEELKNALLQANRNAFNEGKLKRIEASQFVGILKKKSLFYLSFGDFVLFLKRGEQLNIVTKPSERISPEAICSQLEEEAEVALIELEAGDELVICKKDVDNVLSKEEFYQILCEDSLPAQSKAEALFNLYNFRNKSSESPFVVIQQKVLAKKNLSTFNLKSTISKNSFWVKYSPLISGIAALLFCLFIAALFLKSKSEFANANSSLKEKIEELEAEINDYEGSKNLAIQSVSENFFDSFDSEHFRVYGLFRDPNQLYSLEDVTEMFHIYNKYAIKSSIVLGEKWFVVPVKGVHFVEKSDTPASIADLYYSSESDSTLITLFNPIIETGRFIFIPFNK